MIYFTRHGESEANIEKIFSNRGFKHPLTLNGINQAVKLADQLKKENIESIVSSPVLRAVQTAIILSDELNILSFTIHEYLREYDVGDLEDKSDSNSWNLFFENEKAWQDINKQYCKLPNGESFLDIQKRFKNYIIKFIKYSSEKNTLIISHGGLLKIGLPAVCTNINYTFSYNNPINNCELIICDVNDDKLQCLSWGKVVF